MKILLLGEYSSLHKYLKDGLSKIPNVEVILASQGDGWKKIGGADIRLPVYNGGGIKGKIKFYVEYISLIRKMKGFDVVQIISPGVFPSLFGKNLYKIIKRNNKCISLVAAGSDYAVVRAYAAGKYDYYPYDFDKTQYYKYSSNRIGSYLLRKCALYIEHTADVIIPSLYEYTVGYQTPKLSHVIPFPISVEEIPYEENKINGKILFFHGLNRELSKGTPFIRDALNRLKENYPNDVEIVMDGHMPFDEYTKLLKRANVVVDQCCTYGYGINACISMAQGKVVMSGCRKETLDSFGINYAPIILTKPDVDFLYKQMEQIVNNKNHISEIGEQGRRYVENLHDSSKIAKEYMKVWKSTGRI